MTDKLVIQTTMPSGDKRDVFICDMTNQEDMEKLEQLFLAYQDLELNGEDARFGPHGLCTDVSFILHDVHGVISEVILFHMTEEEFKAQLPKKDGGNSPLH